MSDLFNLEGKVALITGASSGLGVQFAKALAGQGADIAICARRVEKLEAVKAEIEELGVKCFATKCDVTKVEDIKAMVAAVEAEYGKAYEEPLLAGHVPSLLPEYDGGGKAAWMLTERIYDSLHYSNSWKNNRFGSEIVIPEKYVSKHARDVRWLFVQNETGRSYVGYEYVIKTGERVRDVYSSSYEVAVYDLVTGENRVYPLTNDRNALEEFINDYFADLEKDQNP